MNSVFNILNAINVNDKIEKKNGLSYLSWAWAWGEIKKHFPNAIYTIYERETEYGPVNYFTDGNTCWVKTGVTIEGLEHIEELPVMDYKNKSIKLKDLTSFDVNKTIQRSLTKACARHGLGLYIYAGEDLPEEDKERVQKEIENKRAEMEKEYIDVRRELLSIGVNFRDDQKTIEYILNKAKVNTQDNSKLNDEEMQRLLGVYNAVLKAKQITKVKVPPTAKPSLEILKKENEQLKETMTKQGIDFTSQLVEIAILQKAKVGTQDITMLDEACIARLNAVYKEMLIAGGII